MIETIESALVSACNLAVPTAKSVESYAGQLEGEISALSRRLPAVFVMFAGSNIVRDDYGESTHNMRFTTLVAAKDLRGKKQARLKTGGAYDMVEALLAALTDQSLDLEIDSLTAERIDLVFVSGTVVVYSIEWQTGYNSQ